MVNSSRKNPLKEKVVPAGWAPMIQQEIPAKARFSTDAISRKTNTLCVIGDLVPIPGGKLATWAIVAEDNRPALSQLSKDAIS
jgi:hypothetical protein